MKRPDYPDKAAFTLVELCVIVALVFVLALLAVPALAGARTNSKAVQCLNNLQRLTAAWQMYASDNADRMVGNPSWAAGAMDWGISPDNTNTAKLIDPSQSPIARYLRAADLYKCPADKYASPVQVWVSIQRVRSVSLNAALGGNPTINNQIAGRTYFAARRVTELNKPGPANTAAMFDEHPDSLDDSAFHFVPGSTTANASWRNLPAGYHGGAGGVSFADGSAVLHRWLDSRTLQPVRYVTPGPSNVPGSPDYTWVNDRMPYR